MKKSILVLVLCMFAGVLSLGATTVPRSLTFESPLPLCEDTGGVQPCTPGIWRPTPMPLERSGPLRQVEPGPSSEKETGAMTTVEPARLPPVTLPVTGGESANDIFISIGAMFVGLGVLLFAIRGRRMVRVNLAALLAQVGPYVLGGDERLRLLSIIRSVEPDQMVMIDLSRCAKK